MFDPLRDYRRLFRAAAWYGVLTIIPHFFLERTISQHFPPTIARPEYYYGFLIVALCWELALFIIARNPLVYRPFLVPVVIEKFGFAACCLALVMLQRAHPALLVATVIEGFLGLFFIRSYFKLGSWTM